MRRWLLVLCITLVGAAAVAAEPPVLDVAAVPHVKEDGRGAYANFLLSNLPRAFAVGTTGAFGWKSGGGAIEQVRAAALASCAAKGATDCMIYAEDLSVVLPGRPRAGPPPVPGPLITGSGYAFVPDPRFVWYGPQAARGLYVWGHGKSASQQDLSNDQPQSYVRAFNNIGFDVVRFARAPLTDSSDNAEGWLRAALPMLRARGWRMLIVGGQSRGAWNSLQMLDTPGLADAVIAVSPASLNSSMIAVQNAELYRTLHAANASTTRVAIAEFRGDAFVPTGVDDRVASLRRGLTGHVAALLMIDQPDGFAGHGAGNGYEFGRRFGPCLVHFVLDPQPPTTCDGH